MSRDNWAARCPVNGVDPLSCLVSSKLQDWNRRANAVDLDASRDGDPVGSRILRRHVGGFESRRARCSRSARRGWVEPPPLQRPLAIFFSSCVLVAGVFGGITVSQRITMIQALPAALCLISIFVFGI